MSETDGLSMPQGKDILTEVEQPTIPIIYDFSSPAAKALALEVIAANGLKTGDKIIGISGWDDAELALQAIIVKTVTDYLGGQQVPVIRRMPVLADAVLASDKRHKFRGKSKDFEITLIETNLEILAKNKTVLPRDEALARTFELKRRILSDSFGGDRSRMSLLECTVSLIDLGIPSEKEASGRSYNKLGVFSARIGVATLNDPFVSIRESSSSSTTFGGQFKKKA